MKRFTLSLLVLGALALYANTPPSPEGGQVMRYQIASGTLPDIRPEQSAQTMFRIDTATGKAWRLAAMPLKHAAGVTSVQVWVEVEEVNGELYKVVMDSLKGP